jgi:hypothetical protein
MVEVFKPTSAQIAESRMPRSLFLETTRRMEKACSFLRPLSFTCGLEFFDIGIFDRLLGIGICFPRSGNKFYPCGISHLHQVVKIFFEQIFFEQIFFKQSKEFS